MSDFLLELRCEEIPARMQIKASDDLARLFTEELAKAGLKPEKLTSFVTPRRLAFIAHNLPLETAAVSEEFKGPRTSAPPQALEGFLRKTGLTQDQLEDRDGVYFAVVEKPGRKTADVLAEAVPAVIRAFPWPKAMRWGNASTTTESLRWVRPLQGIVAILGEELVAIAVEGITSGFATVGHRFHHPGEITIGGASDYAEKLRACHVIVSHAERQAIIAERASALATERGYSLIEDKGLVIENAGLTEWPVPLLGDFDPAFLEVPPEVIQLTLRINQKYFVLNGADGRLAPAFICTANIEAKDGGKAIVEGNGKVLAARLSDARFFWEQDKKTKLAVHAEKLGRITFHEKLGTVADKVERVAKLARWLVESDIILPPGVTPAKAGVSPGSAPSPETPAYAGVTKEQLADLAEQAARLAKADLVTEMVGEFPELQGLMGGYYARAEGLPDAVADAIRDHYKPVGQGDAVPTAPVTVAVSLADKLDSILSFFVNDLKPTGSRDPFALRRSALGVIELLTAQNLRLPISSLNDAAFNSWLDTCFAICDVDIDIRQKVRTAIQNEEPISWSFTDSSNVIIENENLDRPYLVRVGVTGESSAPARKRAEEVLPEILDFFADRLKVQQREAGVRHDLIDAVFALGGEDDLVRLLARVKALQSFVATDDGANLLAGYKRAANILKKEEATDATLHNRSQAGEEDPGAAVLDPDVADALRGHDEAAIAHYTPEPEEASLLTALDAAEPAVTVAIDAEDFAGAMTALASLRAPIDAFFEKVTVNDADPQKRLARLRQLTRIRAAMHKVADFSKIEG
ncbi:MAG TPA: glycine--tRNA ligase subunit beta [Sphingobium sp.]|uniref:glycine--tRNA ligase subunit beta n=1 Tax=Sphingobium sp. TaxID=1912891 RepID=UPI002ED280F6